MATTLAEVQVTTLEVTLRDMFAGIALGGATGPLVTRALISNVSTTQAERRIVAECCYEYADAMLEARKGGASS